MGCTSPPAASVIAELATRDISRHCRRRPPSVVAGPAVLSPAPTMSPKRCRGADSPSSLGIPPIPPPPTPNLAWPGQRRTVREHDTRGNDGGFAPLGASCRRVAPLMAQFPPAMSGHEGRRTQTAGLAAAPPRAPTPPPPRHNGGFCTIRSPLSACRRRVAPLMVQFPPFAGGEVTVRSSEATVRGGVVPKVQTTSATNADKGVSWARWSAMWAQRHLASRVARTRTRYCVR